MSNRLFEAMSQNAQQNQFSQMMNEINKFAQTLKGDPKQMVEQLLNSGQMSQKQFNELAKTANQIAPLFNKH